MKQQFIKGENFEFALIWGENLKFPTHSHDEYVISSNITGHEKLKLDGKGYTAPETVTTLFNPGQLHVGEGTHFLISLYLAADFFPKIGVSNQQLDFEKPLVADHQLLELMRSVVSPILSSAPPNELSEAAINIADLVHERYTIDKTTIIGKSVDWRVKVVQEILLDKLDEIPDVSDLAIAVGLTPIQLHRMFKRATSLPPITWQRVHRLAKARLLLRAGQPAVTVAHEMGFSDQAHLVRSFGKVYGITPGKFANPCY